MHKANSQDPHMGTNKTVGVVGRNYRLNKLRILKKGFLSLSYFFNSGKAWIQGPALGNQKGLSNIVLFAIRFGKALAFLKKVKKMQVTLNKYLGD